MNRPPNCARQEAPSPAPRHRSGLSARRSGAGFGRAKPHSGASPPQASILAPHEDYLDGRWTEGCRNAALLWRELVKRGYSGRSGTVRRWAETRRNKDARANAKATGVTRHVPAGRQLARLLMTDPDPLPKAERGLVAHLLGQVASVADAIAVAKQLSRMEHDIKAGKLGMARMRPVNLRDQRPDAGCASVSSRS